MSYPSGPQGQWRPQQPPQPFGGPPPSGHYHPGAPQQHYGGPSPYGGAAGPYGAPSPYGNGMAPPPGKGTRPVLLIGGIGALVIVAVGAVVSFMGGIGPFSSDQRAIEKLFDDMGTTDGTISAIKPYFCSADQKFMQPVDTSILDDLGIEIPEAAAPSGPAEITDLRVDGDKATAKVTQEGQTDTVHFQKEGGGWKVCMSDDPNMPTLT